MIGGELQERLIPVPYSKSSTDQAVSRFPTSICPLCIRMPLTALVRLCLAMLSLLPHCLEAQRLLRYYMTGLLLLNAYCIECFYFIYYINYLFKRIGNIFKNQSASDATLFKRPLFNIEAVKYLLIN